MRMLVSAAALLVLLLLSSCTDGSGLPVTWVGVGQRSTQTYAVKLIYTTYGTTLFGTYYVNESNSPDGKAEGTIEDGVITMVLSPTTNCQFDFAGTVTENRLTGAFIPRAGCYTTGGTWDLWRQ